MDVRTKRLSEMVSWCMGRPDVERALYANYPMIKDEDVLGLMRELKQRGYYELFTMFLMRGEYGAGVQRALERFCAGKLLRELERVGIEETFEEFERILEEEINTSV